MLGAVDFAGRRQLDFSATSCAPCTWPLCDFVACGEANAAGQRARHEWLMPARSDLRRLIKDALNV